MNIVINFKGRSHGVLNDNDGKGNYPSSSFKLQELFDIIFSDPLCTYQAFKKELDEYIATAILNKPEVTKKRFS